MNDFLEKKNSNWFFAAIAFLTTFPLSFYLSKEGGEITLHFLLLRDYSTLAIGLAFGACALAWFTWSLLSKKQQIGLLILFLLLPLFSLSEGDSSVIWMIWSFQPIIGGMYWGMLFFLGVKSKTSSQSI